MTTLLTRAKEFDLGGTALFRLATLAAGFGANVLAIAVLSRQHGSAAYASYALIASLVNLLPFADLGMGASVVNATADRSSGKLSRMQYRSHVSKARDFMVIFMIVLAALATLAYSGGAYTLLLGNLSLTQGIAEGAVYTFLCIALSIPLGLGARVLQGLGKMKVVVQIGFVGPILQIGFYVPLWLINAPVEYYFVGPGTAYLATALVGYIIARRNFGLRLNFPFGSLVRSQHGGQSLWRTAAPFLLISMGMTVGFQSHRILLSQFGTTQDVASYSLVAQFLGPMLAVTTVVGQNLWSRYRRELHVSTLELGAYRAHLLIFILLGTVFAAGLFAVVPSAASILTGGSVSPSLLLTVGAGAYLLVTAVHQPSAMLLNDSRGLWIQALFVFQVALFTVAGTIWSISSIGAAAPYICMAMSMLFLQVLPSIRMAWKRILRQKSFELLKT